MSIPRDEIVEDFYGGFAIRMLIHRPNSRMVCRVRRLPTEPTLLVLRPALAIGHYNPTRRASVSPRPGTDGFEFDLWSPPVGRVNEVYKATDEWASAPTSR